MPKMRSGNSAGDRTARHSAINRPSTAINGADQRKIAMSRRKASSSFGKVRTNTSPSKKLAFTRSHPGASGTKVTSSPTNTSVLMLAIMLERLRCCASYFWRRFKPSTYLMTGTPVACCIHSASILAIVPSSVRLVIASSTQTFKPLPLAINMPN